MHLTTQEKTMKNDFFKQMSEGPSKTITLKQAVAIACGGGRIYMSKRLAPPLAICNARIYCRNEFVFSSDIDMSKYANSLAAAAEAFDVTLELFYEHGDKVIWSSANPRKISIGGSDYLSMEEAYEMMKPIRDAQARRWAIDRGLVRRTPKEWMDDMRWCIKWKIYDAKYAIQRWLSRSPQW